MAKPEPQRASSPQDESQPHADAPAPLPHHSWWLDRYPLWIHGQPHESQHVVPIRSPYWGRQVALVAQANRADATLAIESASRASVSMRTLSRHERASILRRAAQLLTEEQDLFAQAITAESAKPLRESRTEVQRGIQTISVSADEALRLDGDMVPLDAAPTAKGYLGFTLREPLGVIAAITPFNFPLNLCLHKIAPALAAGNTVVHKPAGTTPITALLLARLFHEAGLPPGALNTIPGPSKEVGDVLLEHVAVQMITFTGSAAVGAELRQRAGLKRMTLELGSNAAVIVLPDVSIPEVAQRCAAAAYAHSGQVCISVQRIYVHQDVHASFVEAFTAAANGLRKGIPEDPETQISCLISEAESERVASWVREATEAGAILHTPLRRDGAKLTPAVVTSAPQQSKLIRQEVFGPVAAINPIASLDDAIAAVNDSDYGLQAGIFTQHLPSAWQAAREIHTGAVLINETPQFRADHMPYGGVKLSGSGREGPRYAIQEMTEPKLIVWKL